MRNSDEIAIHSGGVLGSIGCPYGKNIRSFCHKDVARNTIRGNHRSMARDTVYSKDTIGDAWVAPEEDYERRIEIEEARRALDKITEPMRSCLLLKQQGLSYREIADTLSIKETNVGSLVARGRKQFARVYGKIGGAR